MTPLEQLPPGAWARVQGVFTDIDDTLTTDGTIGSDALQALHRLHAAGLAVIAVTGRPAGWSAPFALAWPVAAIVAENGAVALLRDAAGRLDKRYQQDGATRAANFARMQQVLAQIEANVPGARRAADSAGRECDIAIDHSEFTRLPQAAIDRCMQLMQAAGMHASVSSIHINGWFGEHDKFSGACWILRELHQRPLEAELDRWIYVGDSTNDQAMFERFPHSVGVANIARFADRLDHPPCHVTRAERGTGFAEAAERLLIDKHRPGTLPG